MDHGKKCLLCEERGVYPIIIFEKKGYICGYHKKVLESLSEEEFLRIAMIIVQNFLAMQSAMQKIKIDQEISGDFEEAIEKIRLKWQ